MNITPDHIKLCAKMYETRDTIKMLLGTEEYRRRSDEVRTILEALMESEGCNALQAALRTSKTATDNGHGVTAMVCIATAMDMIEARKP